MRPADFVRGWGGLAVDAALHLTPATAIGPVRPDLAWALMRRSAERSLRRFGVAVHVDDRATAARAPGGALFVHLDQQTLLSSLLYPVALPPCRIVVNVEFALLPWFGWSAVASGAVVVVRQRPAQAKRALSRVVRDLQAGHDHAISIEGRRSRDGSLSPYKKGPVVVAIEAQREIIPFMTLGEWERWPRGAASIRPGPVDVVLFPPMSMRGVTLAERDDVVRDLRALAERERRLRGIGGGS